MEKIWDFGQKKPWGAIFGGGGSFIPGHFHLLESLHPPNILCQPHVLHLWARNQLQHPRRHSRVEMETPKWCWKTLRVQVRGPGGLVGSSKPMAFVERGGLMWACMGGKVVWLTSFSGPPQFGRTSEVNPGGGSGLSPPPKNPTEYELKQLSSQKNCPDSNSFSFEFPNKIRSRMVELKGRGRGVPASYLFTESTRGPKAPRPQTHPHRGWLAQKKGEALGFDSSRQI